MAIKHETNDPDLDNIAKEVNEDIAKGEGEKHFQDLFDEVASTQGNARSREIPPDLRDKLERFARAFRAGLSDQLRGNEHGLHCVGVNLDGFGHGFVCKFKDREGRPYTVGVSYEDGFASVAKHGVTEMGRGMMDVVLGKLVAARALYFERMASS
jgi:hypothetical protein